VSQCAYVYVCRLLICNERTYYTVQIHKITKMQMNKKKEKNTVYYTNKHMKPDNETN